MQWRTRFKRLTASEKHEVINDIFGGETEYNKFYDAVSVIYRIAEFVFLAAALLFAVIYIAANSDDIQYAQFEYMAQNFVYTLNQNTEKKSYMTYTREENRNFAFLGGGLAVCGDERLTLYSATGVRTAYITHGLYKPIPVGSDRHILVYESGGTEYKFYSLYSEMHFGKSEHAIYGACVGKNGSYALITGNDDDSDCVMLYNRNFKLINKYTKYGNVVSVAISDNGEKILIVTVGVNNSGGYSAELTLCTAGSDKADRIISLDGALPLDCRFGSEGFIVLCDKMVCFYDTEGSLISEKKFEDGFDFADISSDCAFFAFRSKNGGDGYSVELFDGTGKTTYSGEFTGTPLSVTAADGCGFVLTENHALCIRGDVEPEYAEVSGISSGDRICALSAREAYVCTPSHAAALNFK